MRYRFCFKHLNPDLVNRLVEQLHKDEVPIDDIGMCTVEMKQVQEAGVDYLKAMVFVRDKRLREVKMYLLDDLMAVKEGWFKKLTGKK